MVECVICLQWQYIKIFVCVYSEFQSIDKPAQGLSDGAQINQSLQRLGMNARTDIVASLTTNGPLSGKSQ